MKKAYRMISFVLALALFATCLPALPLTAQAAAQKTSGYYTYTVANGEATITACDTAISGDVVIPSTLGGYPVTTIAQDAFNSCENITSLTIPSSVKTIQAYTFCSLSQLKTITFVSGKVTIDDWSFDYLPALQTINFGSCDATIGQWSFSYCDQLSSINFGSGFVYVHDNAFFSCPQLTSVSFPSSGAYVGRGVFSNSELLEYATYENCKYLGNATNPYVVLMQNTDYERESLTIHPNTKGIAAASCYAYQMQTITLPDGLVAIGADAFQGCYNPTSVTIGSHVTIIGKNAFERQVAFRVDTNNTAYSADNAGVLFDKAKTTLIQAPESLSGTYTIPASVTKIEDQAFRYCEDLAAFAVAPGNTAYSADSQGILYNPDKTYLVQVPCSISGDVVIPDSVTDYAPAPFYHCRNLTAVTIGKGIRTLSDHFFFRCDNLNRLYLHENITFISDQAIADRYSLEYNTYNNAEYLGSTEKPYLVLMQASSTDITDCQIHPDTKIIFSRAFYECDQLTTLNLPAGLRDIGSWAFAECTALEEITIPAGLLYQTTNHSYDILSHCTGLKTVYLPQDVDRKLVEHLSHLSGIADIYYNGTKAQWDTLCASGGPGKLFFENAVIHTTDSIIAPGVVASGKWGDNLTWTLDNENILTISGTGLMSPATLPTEVTREAKQVVINEGITSICDDAFYGWHGMKEISIPASVTLIGNNAFRDSGLETVTIPNTVTHLGDSLFEGCSQLTSVTLPSGLTAVPTDCFYRCRNLTGVFLPASVSTIGNGAFQDSGLTGITLPSGVSTIGDYAFSNCRSLTAIDLPEGLSTIGRSAFSGCTALADITLPGTLSTLGDSAFYGTAITEIAIPSGVTELEMGTFSNCPNLATVYISISVGKIMDAFYNCPALADVYYSGTRAEWSAIWFGHSNDFTNATIHLRDGILEPGTVMSGTIGDNIFWVLEENGTLTLSGTGAMNGPGGGPDWSSATKIIVEEGITTIGNGMFMGCSNATEVSLPSTLISIGDRAFSDCLSLKTINLPAGLKTIDNTAFGHSGLTGIVIPNGVTSMGYDAFAACEDLTTVVLPGSLQMIPNFAFRGCHKLTSVTIGNGIGAIDREAFWDCTSLTSISIPGTVKTIGENAFLGCTALQNVSIAEGVERLDSGVFSGCTALKTIVIPKSVELLNVGAFRDCSALESITIPFIGPSDYEATGTYQYPLGVLFQGSTAAGFANVDQHSLDRDYGIIPELSTIPAGLKSVTITVGDLPLAAFEGCYMLKQIHLLGTVSRIPKYAFHGCTGLTDVYYSGTQSHWNSLSKAAYNESLNSVTMHFNAAAVPNGWYLDGGKWYFGKNGQNVTGWLLDGGTWYYMDGNGVMQTGWLQLGSTWYYLKSSGAMVTGEYKIGNTVHKFNGSGVWLGEVKAAKNGWILENNKWYFYKNDVKQKGWLQEGPTWYYLDSNGVMVTGEYKIGSATHKFSASGAWLGEVKNQKNGWIQESGKWYYYKNDVKQTGWLQDGPTWYYLDSNGVMVTGEYKIGNATHKFNSSGAWLGEVTQQTGKHGWVQENSKWYYYQNGTMVKGWKAVDGTWYYFKADGVMATGWIQVDSVWYFMSSSGAMKTGWLQQGNTWYYLKSSGAMATGSLTIGQKTYNFNSSGACLNP